MTVERIMARFGRQATLCSSDGTAIGSAKAFLSPLRYKNKMYLYGVNTEIGYNSQGHYLYIGPPQIDLTGLESNEYLSIGSEKYRVDRAEKVYKGEDVFYIWAIVRTIVEI